MSSTMSLKSFSARSRVLSTSSSSSSAMWGTRTPSVYGGAGGYGTRVSKASVNLSTSGSYNDEHSAIITNEKLTMQNLNDRLASYLDKVRSLEASNKKLELQIQENFKSRVVSARDYSVHFATIADLRSKIAKKHLENQTVILNIDNAQLAADDFKMKGDMEMNLRNTAEADVARLRAVRDSLTLTKSDLEIQIEGLKEELVYMKSSHEEEMCLLRAQHGGTVDVEVDSPESVDLNKVLAEVREQYETLMAKNKLELEKWFRIKVESIHTEITTTTEEVKTYHAELSELKKTYNGFEISRESTLSQIQYLQQNLEEVRGRFSKTLSQLQISITSMEEELHNLRYSTETQKSDYNLLLDVKMRLEAEIEEYRRLLGVELEKKAVIISKVEKIVEEHKPQIERRVKTIVEEVVDGVVVKHQEETQIENIQ